VLGGQLDQPLALPSRQRAAGRVVEVRDRVQQLRHPARGQGVLERGHVDAVVLKRHRLDVRTALAQRQQRAVVRGRLDHRPLAPTDHLTEQHDAALERAVGHDHLVRVHAVVLGDPIAQRSVAGAAPVRQRSPGILAENALGASCHRLGGNDVEARSAASEADWLRRHGE
jgi:hypothetical protein